MLQLVNQPESNVFNGDMGEVISIIKAKETIDKKELLVVSYDGIEVTYERNDLNQITLAYCCSIHKSQGSEFPIVIMPVVRSHTKNVATKFIIYRNYSGKKFPDSYVENLKNSKRALSGRMNLNDRRH